MNDRKKPTGIASRWEWVAGAVSALIVLFILGVFVGDALRRQSPPNPSLVMDSVTTQPSGYLVQFTVRNTGTEAAGNLVVEGRLLDGATVVETSHMTIDHVPGGSRHQGGLFFTADPAQHALRIRVLGYQEP